MPECRKRRGLRHRLAVLTLATAAKLTGAQGPTAIAEFAVLRMAAIGRFWQNATLHVYGAQGHFGDRAPGCGQGSGAPPRRRPFLGPAAPAARPRRVAVSEALRQNRIVHDAFLKLAGDAGRLVDVGELAAAMRALDLPMGAWEIRGELVTLREQGLVELDASSARWRPAKRAELAAGAGC